MFMPFAMLLNVSPRCLWCSMNLIGILSNIKEGKLSTSRKANNIASVLLGLKVTNHWRAQALNKHKL